MTYYFDVIMDGAPNSHILVKAENVFEAGLKVEKTFSERGYALEYVNIIEITRTNIIEVID